MASSQRAFVQKLSKQANADVRRQIASTGSERDFFRSVSGAQGSVALSDVVEPVDFEDFLEQHRDLADRDPISDLLEFPHDDLEVGVLPRKCRTVEPIVPEENPEELEPHVRQCLHTHTCDWVVVNRCYQGHSSSVAVHDGPLERAAVVRTTPRREFEVDLGEAPCRQPPPGEDVPVCRADCQGGAPSETPRGSWASSVFDLRNSEADPLLPSLLERTPPEELDRRNALVRQESRHDALFELYPCQDEEEIVERRLPADLPREHLGHRILVRCLALKLELEIEPIFGSMALYDAKERKKVSENFYFDMNPEPLKRMLSSHVPYHDISTLSRACIFNVTYPSTDLFLVVKLEKVLQGDITECAEPYMKDEKNKDKVRGNAVATCERLGKYRMPFAWTAVYLLNVLTGVNSLDRDSDSVGSGTLGRRGSLERRSGSEKRRSWSPDDFANGLDTFRPVTLTVTSFFKQESDKLRDDDLYKFLADLKRPGSVLKRLKSIPGSLRLDISPCPEEVRYCLSPELARLVPYPDEKGRPTKEALEFPPREVLRPDYVYRNLLYVYPRALNFAGRPGSARNIACRIQFMCGEEATCALPVLFGKSSCPELVTEVYTSVTYHSKSPDFQDEVKVKLPARLTDRHHLFFTFYHISCQRKMEQTPTETPIGYTWFPLYHEGHLQTGDHVLPVMLEHPPASYSFLTPSVQIPNTKWVDGHKGLFDVSLHAASTVHPQDPYLDRFLQLCTAVEGGHVPPRLLNGETAETELRASLLELVRCRPGPLVRFLPTVLDALVRMLVQPPRLAGQPFNLGQAAFHALAAVADTVAKLLEDQNDQHGRNALLATYVQYQCTLPHPDPYLPSPSGDSPLLVGNVYGTIGRASSAVPIVKSPHGRSSSNPDLASSCSSPTHDPDSEPSALVGGPPRPLDRTASMRPANGTASSPLRGGPSRKLVHEELVLQWVVSSGTARELALANAWFLLELVVKSMTQHLAATGRLHVPRKVRFSSRFADDVTTLVTTMTSDIISRCHQEVRDFRTVQNLNTSLAFFLYDLLSIMDRGYVFQLIKTFCKQVSAKMQALPEGSSLASLKLDLLRVVCSHEHFVTLNLPFGTPLTPSPPASPCPSIASSQGSAVSGSTLTDRSAFAELSPEYRQQHFLLGLLLSDLATVLHTSNPTLQGKAVNAVRNLLTSHDWDPRFNDLDAVRPRVATLYLPLVAVVVDALPCLYDWRADNRVRFADNSETNSRRRPASIHQSVAMAIAGSSVLYRSEPEPYDAPPHSQLKEEATKHLLACFLWVLKNADQRTLRHWWADWPPQRLNQLLDILYICVSCFEYKGKKTMRRFAQQTLRKTSDIKSKLEDAILGHSSARSEMMMRRRGNNAGSGGGPERSAQLQTPTQGDRLRWRKDQTQWRHGSDSFDRPKVEVEVEAHMEGNLATEVTATVLDVLELIVQVVSQSDSQQSVLGTVLRVLLHALDCSQSTLVLQSLFATQRSLVFKFPELLFEEETEQCADLCLLLLRHCSSAIRSVRSQASASLYLLMRQNFEIGNNFARVKMQVTMSLSSLVGTSQSFNEEFLRKSLKTILVYAEEDVELQETTFPEQVRDLVFNLHMILSDTVKMKEFQEDPEMLLDLMYRIAKGYQNSPDLRLTWLANMAQKHTERGNHAEAAHCLIHSAALVAEYLHMLEDRPCLPVGCISFEKVSHNVLEESAVSDDVLSPDEEGVCTGKYFTENGLVGLLEQAANSFCLAGMYEATNEVYKILIPISESHRDYKKLANIHSKLHEAFTKVVQQAGKRVFGTYFRVGFYGPRFGDLDGEEFIYKEPTLTKLPEISHRLESFYSERFGSDYVEVIKDSNMVDVSRLHPEKAYIQITYVEPYFDMYELRERHTYFDKNYNIKRFVYATPFTPDGRAHGDLHEQYKRKTIVTVANSFPYVKTRIQVVERKQVVLTPIEVAIEDIQKKTLELALATQQEPSDPKILQMVLQGSMGPTVNQGPMEVALVFLSDLQDPLRAPSPWQHKLRLCFKDFSRKCNDALRKNKTLIGADQRDYQKELERNYHRFSERLLPMIRNNSFLYRSAVPADGRPAKVAL
ncbi:dedicator of cytokinesis protein 7 isoform X2 [Ixodes scapularis]|uniref:dedicator of cytokinesis protein 7 isoform X2 n=1 Tax=Ixodes scapularis TaxID=6945 RepID=UPI001AA004C0|nr:dedicator of cytokinesis protein 7 isoform X2 [Ixodes scapularis]